MRRVGEAIQLNASDLVGHLNCRYLTHLDLAVADGDLAKPQLWDPLVDILAERGAVHEKAYVDHLKGVGHQVLIVGTEGAESDYIEETSRLMRSGAQVIVQGTVATGGWIGRADVLRRVETPSTLGAWSYEVIDTKLARETKGATVLQLSLYSDLLSSVQGVVPEFSYVVTPFSDYAPQPFRTADFSAYYRRVRKGLETAISAGIDDTVYPQPIEHCEICRWQTHCEAKRRQDDHLSLVAGIAKSHINELKRRSIDTMAELATVPLPLPWKPDRGAIETYERVREQARIQVEGRTAGKTLYELLPIASGFGLSRLPPPSPGDVFMDLEGDPFVGEGGLEFLFGYAFEQDGSRTYTARWALSRAEERAAFEEFIDFVVRRREQYPDLHIYHFAPYEPAALKRLMGRYATREDELDTMLRSLLFVDLYAIVRRAVRASVESYSIKKLEPLYEFTRKIALSDVSVSLAKVQARLELGDIAGISDQDREVVQAYNSDDCLSAWHLRDWLEERRTELIDEGTSIDRPSTVSGEASEGVSEWQQKIAALVGRLTADVPLEQAERSTEQQARWLLAYALDFHRRENKATWWEYFRLSDLSAEDLLEERAALSGLGFLSTVGGTARAPVHRYAFPPQETELRGGEDLRSLGGEAFGKVEEISLEKRWVDIKKRRDTADLHPEAVFAHSIVSTQVLADSLMRLGEYVADQRISAEGPYQAARDLLMMVAPRLVGQQLNLPGEVAVAAAIRIAPNLGDGVLPVQGPPGAGKTYTGARMICALARERKRVGVTANSHKVIRHLLEGIIEAAEELGQTVECIEKVSENEDDLPHLRFTTDNKDLLAALGHDANVGAGTAWLWAREDAVESVDVLFIDEAAQMSLANVLAVSQCAKSVVLLGDPRQLEQPLQGSHPPGTDVSALDHILAGESTIPFGRGLFLEETWRLHPDICAFTSEMFYDGRLRSHAGLEKQTVKSSARVQGTGLRFIPVVHQGNQSLSPEEAECVQQLVAEILGTGSSWVNRHGVERQLQLEDILIIAPYNAQVIELQDRLPGARIGTVDKFQGQEAPIVIYSMTTSSHADAPRGMEFLYSLNRLNVATSRAKCICVLVASPAAFEVECRTPRQMQLANAFCRYLEMASVI